MTPPYPRSIPPACAQASLLAALLLAGCYTDPNVHSRFDMDGFPSGDIQTASTTLTGLPAGTNATPTPTPWMPGADQSGGRVAVGDSLTVSFTDAPPNAFPPQVVVKVGSDGTFTLPYNKIIHALGKSPTELEREIHNVYVPSLFVNCTASVKAEERYFFVGGEVRVQSRQIFTSHNMTVLRAITTAGGFTDFAKKSRIEIRRANGGKTEYIDYKKALKDPRLDLPVYPNDQVIVPRGL